MNKTRRVRKFHLSGRGTVSFHRPSLSAFPFTPVAAISALLPSVRSSQSEPALQSEPASLPHRAVLQLYNPWLYDVIAPGYDAFARRVASQARRAAIDGLAPEPTDAVLVAGCGTGLSLPGLTRQMEWQAPSQRPQPSIPTGQRMPRPNDDPGRAGWIEGVDVSPGMLRRAKRRRSSLPRAHRIGLRQADVRALPFPDASFDAVLSCYVLDHFAGRDLQAACRELVRVVRPGGRLALVHVAPAAGVSDGLWQSVVSAGLPVLGGSRPIRLAPLLTASGVDATSRRLIQCGLPSMIHVVIR